MAIDVWWNRFGLDALSNKNWPTLQLWSLTGTESKMKVPTMLYITG